MNVAPGTYRLVSTLSSAETVPLAIG